MRSVPVALLAAGALALGACGDDDEDTAQDGGTQPPAVTTTVPDQTATTDAGADGELSAEAQSVLEGTRDLAAQVSATAQDLVQDDITQEQAQRRFDGYRERARDLADQAEALPETDQARDRLVQLTRTVRDSTDEARNAVRDEAAVDDVRRAADRLSDDIGPLLQDLRDEVPAEVQDEIDAVLDRLGR